MVFENWYYINYKEYTNLSFLIYQFGPNISEIKHNLNDQYGKIDHSDIKIGKYLFGIAVF